MRGRPFPHRECHDRPIMVHQHFMDCRRVPMFDHGVSMSTSKCPASQLASAARGPCRIWGTWGSSMVLAALSPWSHECICADPRLNHWANDLVPRIAAHRGLPMLLPFCAMSDGQPSSRVLSVTVTTLDLFRSDDAPRAKTRRRGIAEPPRPSFTTGVYGPNISCSRYRHTGCGGCRPIPRGRLPSFKENCRMFKNPGKTLLINP